MIAARNAAFAAYAVLEWWRRHLDKELHKI
jgi:hypothetical protein